MTTQILVIGAGYAGLLATIRLSGKVRGQNVSITLINASDTFLQRVKLHQFAAGRNVEQCSLSEMLRGTGVAFQPGTVTNIDTSHHKVLAQTATGMQTFSYDYLVYALGSTFERDAVPGVKEYAYSLTATGPLSALTLREKLPILERTGGQFVVCGGGLTGVESVAEFAKAFPKLHVHMVTQDGVAASMNETIAGYIRRTLTHLNMSIHDHTTITEITPNQIIAADGTILPYNACLWAGGFTVPTLARDAGLTVNERGQILIDPFMRSVSHPEIYALGDVAMPVEEPGVPVRMSAFTAVVMGAHGADCLNSVIRGKAAKPLSFAYAGQGIALGHHNAIGFNTYPADKPNLPYFTGRFGYESREFFVRFLTALPGLEKRWPGFFFWPGKGRYAAKQRVKQYVGTEREHAA